MFVGLGLFSSDSPCSINRRRAGKRRVYAFTSLLPILAFFLSFGGAHSFKQDAPHVFITSPTQNELNVAVSTAISVVFDVDMDDTTFNDSTFVVNARSTGLQGGTITYDSLTRTASLNPTEGFDEGEVITVVLTTGIQSSQGISLDSSYVWSFTIVANDGTGSFAPHSVYSVGDGPQSVFAADLDGNGDLDLITANWFSNNVSVLLNSGDGTFGSNSVYPVAAWPYSVFAADLDRDGDLDLITANWFSNNISVLLNNGDATFGSDSPYPVAARPYSVFAADLDGDGHLDLATANEITNDVSVLLNNGDGTFASHLDYPAGDYPSSVFAGDFDGDGHLDLATANQTSDDVSVLLNNGDGSFSSHLDYPTGNRPYSIFAGDLDLDGDLDITTANLNSDSVSVLLNNGDGTFASRLDYSVGSASRSVFAADLDGDGDLDLTATLPGQDNVSVLLNNGDGTFAPHLDYPTGDDPVSVFAGDLDGDGDLDLVTANVESDNVSVLLNQLISECSLWALPDTVIVGQSISLRMRVENIGGVYADSVVPQINTMGDGNVSLDSGPIPPYVNMAPGSDTTFSWVFTADSTHWVYWTGCASGTDHNTGSMVTSPEDTSNEVLIQTAPNIVFVYDSVEPDTMTQGQISGYTMAVRNDGEAWLRITPQTTFWFNDTDGDTLRTRLSDSTLIPGLTNSVILSFDTVSVPSGMVAGDWLSWLHLDGIGRNEYRHSFTLVGDLVTIQERPAVEDLPATVNPDEVSQGQSALFRIGVMNSGGVGVTLNTLSRFSFTDGLSTYDSYLSGVDSLEVGISHTLDFMSATVPSAIQDSSYPIILYLYGADFNGAEYGDTVLTTGNNLVAVKTPAYLEVLAVIAGADTVCWGQENVLIDVVVQNSGGARAVIDSANLRFLRGSDNLDSEYSETLLTPIDSLPGFSTDILHFTVNVDSCDTTGWVTIHSRVFGRDVNSNESVFDTTASLPDSFYVTEGYACGDCNGDGKITVADAAYLVSLIYRAGPMVLGPGDVNLDGKITMADAIYIIAYIYRQGPAPCSPLLKN